MLRGWHRKRGVTQSYGIRGGLVSTHPAPDQSLSLCCAKEGDPVFPCPPVHGVAVPLPSAHLQPWPQELWLT